MLRVRGCLLALTALAGGAGACQFFWPERLAVNAPIRQMLFGRGIDPPSDDVWSKRLQVPDGFRVGRFADNVPNARILQFSPTGDLLVSQPRRGEILLLFRDADGDGRSDGRRVLMAGLNRPHGLALHGGWLYIGETDAIARARFEPETGEIVGNIERIVTGLPSGGNHWSRSIGFGPDGRMYVSVGSSCNVCIESDPRRATILRYEPDGSGFEIYASGLRNSVGFDWRPETNELYATDNGRDLLGDDFPPCELNRIDRGAFYGWPFANGSNVPDPDFGSRDPVMVSRSGGPAHAFRAHNAPLGITFIRNPNAPPLLRGAALVALHGSWNRTRKDGYLVVSLHWDRSGNIEERPYLWGFLRNDEVIGRPVDVAEGPDNAVYVSDDYAASIYRITFGPAGERVLSGATPTFAARSALKSLPDSSVDHEAVSRGAALFARHGCPTCHEAENAAPGIVPTPLAGLASRQDAASIDSLLATPPPPMPAFPLSKEERRDLTAYLRATYP